MFYWQCVPIYFALAMCPHIFFILRIFIIVDNSFKHRIRFFVISPFSSLPFLRCVCLFFLFLLQERHERFRRHSRISLSSVNEDTNDSISLLLSELLTMWMAFFPTKAEGTSLHPLRESLENVSVL